VRCILLLPPFTAHLTHTTATTSFWGFSLRLRHPGLSLVALRSRRFGFSIGAKFADMVSSKKRGRQDMEGVAPQEERSMIERIRNMWEFANLAQWIYIFGKAVKIDEDLDIEVGRIRNLVPSVTYLRAQR
jgi:hypothetical protein